MKRTKTTTTETIATVNPFYQWLESVKDKTPEEFEALADSTKKKYQRAFEKYTEATTTTEATEEETTETTETEAPEEPKEEPEATEEPKEPEITVPEGYNDIQAKAYTFFVTSGLSTLTFDKVTYTKDKPHIVITSGKCIVRLQPTKKGCLIRCNKAFTEKHPGYKFEEHKSWSQPYACDNMTLADVIKCFTPEPETKAETKEPETKAE